MTMLVPILAGIGALCMSNPGKRRRTKRRKAKSRRRVSRRRNPGHKMSFEEAKNRYVHRYTMEHVPAWAKSTFKAQGGTKRGYPAPQYKTDREWYEDTTFPGDPGYKGLRHARSGAGTWPLGKGPLSAPLSSNPGKRRKGKRKGKWQSPGSAASRLAWWRWHSNPSGQRDLTVTNHRRGDVDVTIACWRNANATAFIAVSASGPRGVKSWEAKSQGPSAGGYSKPTQAAERVFQKITGEWASWGGVEKEKIADAAAAAFGTKSNPRRRKSRRKSRR